MFDLESVTDAKDIEFIKSASGHFNVSIKRYFLREAVFLKQPVFGIAVKSKNHPVALELAVYFKTAQGAVAGGIVRLQRRTRAAGDEGVCTARTEPARWASEHVLE